MEKVVKPKGNALGLGEIHILVAVAGLTYLLSVLLGTGEGFEFTARTGVHHIAVPTVSVILYLISIFLVFPRFSPSSKSMEIPVLIHNIFLSALSLLMLVNILKEVSVLIFEGGFEAANCDSAGRHVHTTLYYWYYVFYLSKIYEFIDTIILCLKQKKLIFLHVYHHVITLWLCWVMIDDRMSMQWLCAGANMLVHVFMYYFYACQSLGINIWWKKYLTSLQILQFILDELGNVSWVYHTVIEGRKCSGSWTGFWFGMGVIFSFLVLFINFFKKTYSGKGKGAKEM